MKKVENFISNIMFSSEAPVIYFSLVALQTVNTL